MDEQLEGQEVSGLEQIIQLAQSGDPQALPQIGQIAMQMLEMQKAEMGAQAQPEEGQPQDLRAMLQKAGGAE